MSGQMDGRTRRWADTQIPTGHPQLRDPNRLILPIMLPAKWTE